MIYDLLYTSAPKTLDGSGYGVVIRTQGFPHRLEKFVRELCYYDFLAPADSDEEMFSPAVYSHLMWEDGGARWHILSRVGPGGRDYTHRTVFLAHHLAIADHVFNSGSPARLMKEPNLFRTKWNGTVGETEPREIPKCPGPPSSAATWTKVAGDALWSQASVERWRQKVGTPLFLIAPPQTDMLGLFTESLAFVPDREARDLTFSTLLANERMPARLDWVGLAADTAVARKVAMKSPDRVIDLTRPLGSAPKVTVAAPALAHAPTPPRAVERDEFADFLEEPPRRRKPTAGPVRGARAESSSASMISTSVPPPPPLPPQSRSIFPMLAVFSLAVIGLVGAGMWQFRSQGTVKGAPGDEVASKGSEAKAPAPDSLPSTGSPSTVSSQASGLTSVPRANAPATKVLEENAPGSNGQGAQKSPNGESVGSMPAMASSAPPPAGERKFDIEFIASGDLQINKPLQIGIDGMFQLYFSPSAENRSRVTWDQSKVTVSGTTGELSLQVDNSQLMPRWVAYPQQSDSLKTKLDQEDCRRKLELTVLEIAPGAASQRGKRLIIYPEEKPTLRTASENDLLTALYVRGCFDPFCDAEDAPRRQHGIRPPKPVKK